MTTSQGEARPVEAPKVRSTAAERMLRVILATLLGFVILVEINLLNSRHFIRFDVTGTRRYSLSQKSIQIARSLEKSVRVKTSFVGDDDAQDQTRELLGEYGQYSKNFILEENIDFVNDPTAIQEFARRYKFSTIEEVTNKIVFDYNDAEKVRIVKMEDLVSYDQFDPMTGARGAASFHGEEKITGALLGLTEEEKTGVYFTVGHGERAIHTLRARGISKWRRFLEVENYKVDSLDLLAGDGIPDDCDVIVAVGPVDPFRPEEEEKLKAYLDGGGRLLLLLGIEARCGLGKILIEWGVDLGEDLIVVEAESPAFIVVGEYAPHPITDPLEGQRITPFLARSVDTVRPLPEGVEGGSLFDSPADSWAETAYRRGGGARLDPEDKEGPLPMAVALERKGEGKAPARLVVIGSHSFVENGRSFGGMLPGVIEQGANDDLAMNLIGWLTERERVVGIGPKKVGIPKIRPLEKGDIITIYLVCLAILPGICLVAGFSLWWVRRG